MRLPEWMHSKTKARLDHLEEKQKQNDELHAALLRELSKHYTQDGAKQDD